MGTLSDNLTGSLAPEKDLVFPEQPKEPEMRESISVWLFEENGAFGFPRMGIEAEAQSWNDRRLQAAFTFPDGRTLNGAARGAPPAAINENGRPTIIGAGPLTFRCIEPFRRWQMIYDGSAFGSLAYPPREGTNGEYSYNDAVIYKDGRLYPARIVKAPFLRRIVASGDEMVLELESDLGRTVIEGTTALNTFRVGNPDIGGLNLQQGGTLFRWGKQKAYGMCERSTHEGLTTFG